MTRWQWQIPGALPVGWQMRALDTASITAGYLEDGRFRQRVEHAPLAGVTPAMCLWYLERVDRPLTWRGHTALAYRFWHPRDHIFFRRRGSFGPGDRWHIVEAFGPSPALAPPPGHPQVDLPTPDGTATGQRRGRRADRAARHQEQRLGI